MKLKKTDREELRMKFGGKCAYCGYELPEKGWHADHIESVMRESVWQRSTDDRPGKFVSTGKLWRPENDRKDNLAPSCYACNISKGACDLEQWRKWLECGVTERLRRDMSAFRHAERFGRVIVNEGPLVFWFEQFVAEKAA